MVIAVAKIAMNTMFYGLNSLKTTMRLVDTRHLLNDRHAAAAAAVRFGWNDVWTIWLNYLNCECLAAHLVADWVNSNEIVCKRKFIRPLPIQNQYSKTV